MPTDSEDSGRRAAARRLAVEPQPTGDDAPARRPYMLVAAFVAALGLLVLLAVVSRL